MSCVVNINFIKWKKKVEKYKECSMRKATEKNLCYLKPYQNWNACVNQPLFTLLVGFIFVAVVLPLYYYEIQMLTQRFRVVHLYWKFILSSFLAKHTHPPTLFQTISTNLYNLFGMPDIKQYIFSCQAKNFL